MTSKKLLLTCSLLAAADRAGRRRGRASRRAELGKPLADSWPTYSGDYTGKRYSALTQVDQTTVKRLGLAWVAKVTAGTGHRASASVVAAAAAAAVIVGGGGPADFPAVPANIKGTPLMVNGTLYVTTPDNAWALDARDGRELWHYFWRTKGSTPIANRGVGIWNDYLYFVTPDNFFVSLDAKTGKERWNKVHADFNQQYFSTMAPIVVDNHVIVGTGNDLDSPGYIQSFDPETGEVQWRFYTVPMKAGDPGPRHLAEPATPPGTAAVTRGCPACTTRRRALHLRHRQPDSGLHGRPRRGRQPVHLLAGRRQRRHRQDGVVLPDLAARHARLGLGADADPVRRDHQGQAAQAGLDRRAQRLLLHARPRHRRAHRHDQVRRGDQLGEERRQEGLAAARPGEGPDDSRRADLADLGRHDQLGAAGLLAGHEACSTSPRSNGFSIYYLTDPDPRGSMGLGGKEEVSVGSAGNFLTAIDPTTGKIAWRRPFPGAAAAAAAVAC